VDAQANQSPTVSNEAIGNERQIAGIKSALDDLFRATLEYRKSESYLDLMRFISRFPRYAPFNGFLLFTQNPKITCPLSTSKTSSVQLLCCIWVRPARFLIRWPDLNTSPRLPSDRAINCNSPLTARSNICLTVCDELSLFAFILTGHASDSSPPAVSTINPETSNDAE